MRALGLALCALAAGCFSPRYRADLQCGQGGECPPGFECRIALNQCVGVGSVTDAAIGPIDTTPPAFQSSMPADGATLIDPLATVQVILSEPVLTATVHQESMLVTAMGASTSARGRYSVAGNLITFAPSPLQFDTEYTVSLTAAIMDLAGNALLPHSFSFRTRPQPFGSPILLETSDEPATWPDIAVLSFQKTLAVWQQSDGTRTNIAAAERGFDWTPATSAETSDTPFLRPRVTPLGNGEALALWLAESTPRPRLMASHYRGAQGWTAALSIDGTGTAAPVRYEVEGDGRGHAFAAWTDSSGALVAVRFRSNGGWDPPLTIAASGVAARDFALGVESAGDALVVYAHGPGPDLHSRRYRESVDWEPGARSLEQLPGASSQPAVGYDVLGNAMMIFSQDAGSAVDLYAVYLDKMGGDVLGAPVLVEQEAGDATGARVALGGSGTAVAVWMQQVDMTTRVAGARWTREQGWETTTLLDPETGHPSELDLALDDQTRGWVLWTQPLDGQPSILASQYVEFVGFQAPFPLEQANTGPARGPRIGLSRSQSDAIAIWEQSDGTRESVWAYALPF